MYIVGATTKGTRQFTFAEGRTRHDAAEISAEFIKCALYYNESNLQDLFSNERKKFNRNVYNFHVFQFVGHKSFLNFF